MKWWFCISALQVKFPVKLEAVSRIQVSAWLPYAGPECWSKEWTGLSPRWWTPKSITSLDLRWRGWSVNFSHLGAALKTPRLHRLQQNQKAAQLSKVHHFSVFLSHIFGVEVVIIIADTLKRTNCNGALLATATLAIRLEDFV